MIAQEPIYIIFEEPWYNKIFDWEEETDFAQTTQDNNKSKDIYSI